LKKHESHFLIFRHGSLAAGIVGAERGNDMCSAGVAYNATLVGRFDGKKKVKVICLKLFLYIL